MQFERMARHAPRPVTSRMVKAYARSCAAKQAALPLLAPLIAEAQLPADAEMERRAVARDNWEASSRSFAAAGWRTVRARLFALPVHARQAVLARYNSSRWYPRKSGTLSSLIWSVLWSVDVPADTLVPIAPSARIAAIHDLNARARRGDTWTRVRRAYSPGTMAFLAPGFVPDDDYQQPHLNLHTVPGRWSLLYDRIANYGDFSHNVDPSGENRAGVFDALGTGFRFEVLYLSHQGDGPSVAPWNMDLSRRVIWIGLPDEVCDLTAATISEGWTPPS